MTKSTKLLTIDWENLSLAGNDKALEESTFSYKSCCNDETGILSMFKINDISVFFIQRFIWSKYKEI